jgi:metalloprotease
MTMKKNLSLCASAVASALLLSACQGTGGLQMPTSIPSLPTSASSSAPAQTASATAANKSSSTPSSGSSASDSKSGAGGASGAAGALTALSSVASALPGSGVVGGAAGYIDAGKDAVKALSITDEEVKQLALSFAKQSDAENKVAPDSSPYAKRLTKLTRGLTRYDGMNLNYKVYLSENVNAFAMADGTVRVYSGLMDLMNDDELRFVIGHEIAHVKLGHNSASIRNAYQSSAVAKAGATAVASNSKAGAQIMALGGQQIKDIFAKVLSTAHSRSQESEADTYSVGFMQKNKIPTKAASGALIKLAKNSGGRGASLLSSHPDPADRATAVDKIAAK